jgi:hypothetical protein
MKTAKDEEMLDKVSFILCILVAIGMMTLLLYHTFKSKEEAEAPQDNIAFHIENVVAMEPDTTDGYQITYLTDTAEITLFTSVLEGDYLKVYLDSMDLYIYNQSIEDIDDLQSYLLNNSRIEYLDNPWFQGYIWVYDACPIYRFPDKTINIK